MQGSISQLVLWFSGLSKKKKSLLSARIISEQVCNVTGVYAYRIHAPKKKKHPEESLDFCLNYFCYRQEDEITFGLGSVLFL